MEPEIHKPVAECRHWFQFVVRVDSSNMQQVCRKCHKVLFEWKDTFKDVRVEDGGIRP
jgi:hypothetical protein